MAPTTSRTPRKRVDIDREIAESPYPIMSVKPKGVKNKWEGRIDYEKLRKEMAQQAAKQAARPITPPPRPSGTLIASPRKKRKPEDIMFIKRKPSVPLPLFLDAPPERTRRVSSPSKITIMSPSRSPTTRRIASGPSTITGPAPELFYAKVPQVAVYPPDVDTKNPPVYSEKENDILGSEPKIGCCVSMPDAISRAPLNIEFKKIRVVFEWKGYEVLGPFCEEVRIQKSQSDPLGERLKIIKAVNKNFQEFKELVKKRRERGKMEICHPDVLAFGNGDIRVTRLTYRCSDIYQVEFAYPARPRR